MICHSLSQFFSILNSPFPKRYNVNNPFPAGKISLQSGNDPITEFSKPILAFENTWKNEGSWIDITTENSENLINSLETNHE